MRRIFWALVLMAGCSDPTRAFSDDPDESATVTVSEKETEATQDETDETVSETAGSASETGSGSGSATVDTGSATAETGSGTVDSDTVPDCWLSCMSLKSECQLGSVVIGRCPNAAWCCEPKAVDTGTVSTDTSPPCSGTCSNWSGCAGDWHKIPGSCPNGKACCEEDSDTGSATVDTDTNPEPCPQGDPKYICERRGLCTTSYGYEDTDYYCTDPVNWACCRKLY